MAVAASWLTVALSLPGLAGFLGQASMGWWTWIGRSRGAPGWRDLVGVVSAFVAGPVNPFVGRVALGYTVMGLAAGVGLAGLGFAWGWRQGKREEVVLAGCMVAVPLALAFLVAQWRPLFLLRYLVAFQPFFLILVAAGVGGFRRASWQVVSGIVLVALFLPGLWGIYAWPQKEDWRGVAALLEVQGQGGDQIVLVDEDIHAPLNYYYHGELPERGVSRFQTNSGELADLVEELARADGRVWLVISHNDTDALERAFAASAHWEEDLRADFRGVKVRRYRVRLPDRPSEDTECTKVLWVPSVFTTVSAAG